MEVTRITVLRQYDIESDKDLLGFRVDVLKDNKPDALFSITRVDAESVATTLEALAVGLRKRMNMS